MSLKFDIIINWTQLDEVLTGKEKCQFNFYGRDSLGYKVSIALINTGENKNIWGKKTKQKYIYICEDGRGNVYGPDISFDSKEKMKESLKKSRYLLFFFVCFYLFSIQLYRNLQFNGDLGKN